MKFITPLLLYSLLICLLTTCHKFPNPYIHGSIAWTANNDTYYGKSLAVANRSHSDSVIEITGIQDNDNNLILKLEMATAPGVYIAGESYWNNHSIQVMYSGEMYLAYDLIHGSKVVINITARTQNHIAGSFEGKALSLDRQPVNLKGSFDLNDIP